MQDRKEQREGVLLMQLTMCPQPKAMSFPFVRQIGQSCIQIETKKVYKLSEFVRSSNTFRFGHLYIAIVEITKQKKLYHLASFIPCRRWKTTWFASWCTMGVRWKTTWFVSWCTMGVRNWWRAWNDFLLFPCRTSFFQVQ